MNNWKEITLGDTTEYISRGISPAYSDAGILVVNQKCIRDKKISFGEARFTDSETRKITADKLLKSVLPPFL